MSAALKMPHQLYVEEVQNQGTPRPLCQISRVPCGEKRTFQKDNPPLRLLVDGRMKATPSGKAHGSPSGVLKKAPKFLSNHETTNSLVFSVKEEGSTSLRLSMLRDLLAGSGRPVVRIEGKMNTGLYRDFLDGNLLQSS